jgi:hypothetical protein
MLIKLQDGEVSVDNHLLSVFGFFEFLNEFEAESWDLSPLPIKKVVFRTLLDIAITGDIDISLSYMPELITIEEGDIQETILILDVSEVVVKYIEQGNLQNRCELYKASPELLQCTIEEVHTRRAIVQGNQEPFYGIVELTENFCSSLKYETLIVKGSMLFEHALPPRKFKFTQPNVIVKQILSLGNVVIAGGYPLSCVLSDNVRSNDYDIFFWGLNENQAYEKVCDIEKILGQTGIFTGNSLTFSSNGIFQIVCRLYSSPSEIIHGFDIQACKVLMLMEKNEIKYYGTKSFVLSITHNIVWVDTERQSKTYAYRLMKYFTKNFNVLVTGLERSKLKSEIMCVPIKKIETLEGLSLLMRLEREVRGTFNDMSSYYSVKNLVTQRRALVHFTVQRTLKGRTALSDYSDYAEKLSYQSRLYEIFYYHVSRLKQLGWFLFGKNIESTKITWVKKDPSSQTIIGSFHPEDTHFYRQAYTMEYKEHYDI